MKSRLLATIIAVVMVLSLASVALAEPDAPSSLTAVTISPASGAYPGQTVSFLVDWSASTGPHVAGDGLSICIYYAQNYNQTTGVTDGFQGAAATITSLGFGQDYTKVGPGALGAGVGGGTGTTQACSALAGRYVVGYVLNAADNGGDGVADPADALQIDITLPRGSDNDTFTIRQRRDATAAGGLNVWAATGFTTRAYTVNAAANTVYAGNSIQCGASVPCYNALADAITYVADNGTVSVLGAFSGNSITVNRNMIIDGGSAAAAITGPGTGNALTVNSGATVTLQDVVVTSGSGAGSSAINVAGSLTAKGNTINAAGQTAFTVGASGNLDAYANNVSGLGTALSSAGTANLGHNWWGSYASQPTGLSAGDWAVRLGAPVVSYADGTNSATLNGATLSNGFGTAVIVSHGRSNPPFGNGITPFINSMCGEYFDFFVRNATGTWTVAQTVDNSAACNLNARDQGLVYHIANIGDCATASDTACWDKVVSGVSVGGQVIYAAGFSTAQLQGSQFVVGSSTGTDPTAIVLRDLNATPDLTPWPLILAAVVVVAAMLALSLILRRRTAKA